VLDPDLPYNGNVNPANELRIKIYKELKSKPLSSSSDWDKHPKLKDALRDSYSTEQKGLCAYCRSEIEYNGKHEDLEHIIHKDFNFNCMFDVRNLVLSCKICNTSKGVKHSLKAKFRDPNFFYYNTDNYKIIHPHLDPYEQHIIIQDFFFTTGITPKGRSTIVICDLWRPHLAIKRAKKHMIDNHSLTSHTIHRMRDLSLPKWERRKLRELFIDVVNKRPL
jgi:uncharacterized protein (TIGR02646 family)